MIHNSGDIHVRFLDWFLFVYYLKVISHWAATVSDQLATHICDKICELATLFSWNHTELVIRTHLGQNLPGVDIHVARHSCDIRANFLHLRMLRDGHMNVVQQSYNSYA